MKNVSRDDLDGKVGRVYMPAQDVGEMALHKMKVSSTTNRGRTRSENEQEFVCRRRVSVFDVSRVLAL